MTRTSTTGTPHHAVGHLLANALSTAGTCSAGTASPTCRDELEALARRQRLEPQAHVRVLVAAACLVDELAFLLDGFTNSLAIGHLRPAELRVDSELAQHAVDDDLEMQLAHAADIVWPDSASTSTRNVGSSRTSVASASLKRRWSAAVFGSTPAAITGSGKSIISSVIGLFGIREAVARRHVLEVHRRRDVAGADLVDLGTLVGVHLNEAASLGLVALRDVNGIAGAQARPNTHGRKSGCRRPSRSRS